ncbi:MAG: thioester reductase domain-containing protein, partial [Vulcanococcus sp.]
PGLTVYCLVRAESAGSGRARLRSNLEHYDLWQEDWASRIVAVPGDLAQPRLGLESTTWEGLVERISGVLHNGAQLSYVAPYGQLKASNVSGTLEVLRLAAAAGAPVEYISSTSVYEAAAYRGQELDERSDLAEWRGIHLGYSQSKWVSERLVWQAAAEGLPVRIYRPPLIAGHSQTGAWHEQDFLHRLVRGCLALQQAPLLPMELDLVPVDYVVNAVGALAWSPVDGCDVLHLHHPRPVLWQTFLEGLIAQGAPLAPVPLDQWLAALAEQPSNPLYPLQPFFTHSWGVEQLTYPELNAPGLRAKPSCTASRERLSAFGIACPDFEQLVAPYARTFLLHG